MDPIERLRRKLERARILKDLAAVAILEGAIEAAVETAKRHARKVA